MMSKFLNGKYLTLWDDINFCLLLTGALLILFKVALTTGIRLSVVLAFHEICFTDSYSFEFVVVKFEPLTEG